MDLSSFMNDQGDSSSAMMDYDNLNLSAGIFHESSEGSMAIASSVQANALGKHL